MRLVDLSGLGVVAKAGRIRHANELVFDDGLIDLERLGHQRAQPNRVRPVGDDEKFAVAKAVWSRRISRTGEWHGKSALAHIIFFHDVLSVLTRH
jgi:hypothetical protein